MSLRELLRRARDLARHARPPAETVEAEEVRSLQKFTSDEQRRELQRLYNEANPAAAVDLDRNLWPIWDWVVGSSLVVASDLIEKGGDDYRRGARLLALRQNFVLRTDDPHERALIAGALRTILGRPATLRAVKATSSAARAGRKA